MSIRKVFLLLLVVLFALFIRFFWAIYSGGIVGDEPFSYSISTPSNLNDNGEIFKKKWNYFRLTANKTYKGKFLKDIFFKAEDNSLGKDLKMMYVTTNDDGHSNFYYSLFRIYNCGFSEIDPIYMKFMGIIFNIILCSFAMLVMFRLLRTILKEDKHIPLAMLIAFLNAGSISCTMFVREYQLQMIFFILVSYIFVRIYNTIEQGEKLYHWFLIFLYSLSLALFTLSGYYSEVYTVILGGILLYKAYKLKRTDWIIALIAMYLGHFIIAQMLYLGFFNFLTSKDFPQEPFNFVRLFKRFIDNTGFMYFSLFYFPVLALISITLGIYFKKNKTFKNTKCNILLILAAATMIWSYIIIFIAHLNYVRYVMAGYPVLALAIVWLIVNIDSKLCSFLFGLTFVIYSIPLFLNSIPPILRPAVYFVHYNFGHMEDLMKSGLPIYFKNDNKFPIYATSEVILYTADDSDIQIVSDMNYFTSKENPNDKFIVITRMPEDYNKSEEKRYEKIFKKLKKYELDDYCMYSGWHCFPVTKDTYYKIDKLEEDIDLEETENDKKGGDVEQSVNTDSKH